jgi:hypothetical protein
MECGVWCTVYDVWSMVHGVWFMVYDVWFMECGVWCMVGGVWFIVHGVWCMVHGVWSMVCCVWLMVDGAWCMVYEHLRGDVLFYSVITNCNKQTPLAKLIVSHVVTNIPLFLVPDGSLRSSQNIATCSYNETDESNRIFPSFALRSI